MPKPTRVKLVEVGPRDGLQNEKQPVSTSIKVELIHRLQEAGLKHIEVTSFVSPKWVPQMSDGVEVMTGINRREEVCYSILTPNMKGFELALLSKPNEIVVFAAASETFSQRNINCSIDESIDRFKPVVEAALMQGIKVRGAISCVVGCPYEGLVPSGRVGQVAKKLKEIGVQHIGVADTIGVGTPIQLQNAMHSALEYYSVDDVSGHFHDTYGMALANILACLDLGIWQFDASVAGLGGCPYAKGATGNVATEDVVYMLHGMGIDTGVNLGALVDAGEFISKHLGRPSQSRVARALIGKRLA